MIGVVTHERDRQIVGEFFELFKTPWEFHVPGRPYEVVLSNAGAGDELQAPLVISFDAGRAGHDHDRGWPENGAAETDVIRYGDRELPLYGGSSFIADNGRPFLWNARDGRIAGTRQRLAGRSLVRIGYDPFREAAILLERGQPPRRGGMPTLEWHIDIIRDLIANEGIPVVEIPPIPAGYRYAVCLTHDIDFLRFRDHLFDRTMLGFTYRASLGSVIRLLQGQMSLRNVLKNFRALMKAPLVHLGLCPDFWVQIPLYMELEKDWKSTFFFIPFEGRPGVPCGPGDSKSRAARYDVTDIAGTIMTVVDGGFEVGLHGIDAWADKDSAAEERRRLEPRSGTAGLGVRMHWLYWDKDTFRILDEAGFAYDSTFGYNDTVGYRAGTVQAYRPPGVDSLLELPLNAQDTALFFPGRMHLTEKDASIVCERLMENSRRFGGALTLLWHDRSMAPERLWGDFYRDLLGTLEGDGAWIGPAGRAVQWFRKRRAAVFERVERVADGIEVRVKSADGAPDNDVLPGLLLRVQYRREERESPREPSRQKNVIEMPLNINATTRVPLR